MTTKKHYSPLFQIACRVLKYSLLGLFGFAIACLLAAILGARDPVLELLPLAWLWFFRLTTVNGCLLATAVIAESLRN